MLKSSRLVAITGCLLGLSVTLLPLGTHAVTITQQEVNVSATIDGYLSFTAVSHTPTTNVSSYSKADNKYYGTFNVGDHTEAFGTSRYQVSCNFLSDNDFTPNTCQHGWKVSATVTNSENDPTKNYDATTHEAIMVPGNPQNAYTIKSNKTNGLTGANSNWLIKITGDTRTYQDGSTVHPAGAEYTDSDNNIARDYTDFEAIPYGNATNKTVVTGNTFTPVTNGNTTTYTYKGYQEFDVTYGFSAGHATADTYTGTITYTLSVNAAS